MTMNVLIRRILYRIIYPFLWRWVGNARAARITDSSFRRLFSLRQSPGEFIQDFHDAARLRFFFHPRNQKDFFLFLLSESQPYDSILSDARDVVEHNFEAFGSGKIQLGDSINWRKDFRSGKEWPLKPLSAPELLDVENPSDVKIVWELNRFHQIWWLGKAYWLTKSEEYALTFAKLVEDWIEKNPVGAGPNWSIAMEVSIRACNWVAGYYLFCDSPSLTPEFWQKFMRSLYAHGRYIESHLEYARRNGNHLLADIVGLLLLGLFFRSASFGQKWTIRSAEALQEEMATQVYPDGVDYEKSISYHRLVLEMFSAAAILCAKNRITLGEVFTSRLEKMYEFVLAYTRPDGSSPVVGDADDARLFQFAMHEDFNDHRQALSVGAILFERGDLRTVAGRFTQDALWLFGGEGFETYQRIKPMEPLASSHAFPEGGFYVIRSHNAHVFVDAGDLGMNGRGGHGHNDTLSFEFWCDGQPLIVDSGTFTYTADVRLRNEFRRTQAHNTITIDGVEQAEFSGLWSVRSDLTDPRVLQWNTTTERDILEAEHYAYRSLPSQVVHRRRFEFIKSDQSLTVTDAVSGNGTHLVESFLHFAPGISVEIQDPQKAIARNEKGRYIITVSGGTLSLEETWYSPSYGVKHQNLTLIITVHAELPARLEMVIRRDFRADNSTLNHPSAS